MLAWGTPAAAAVVPTPTVHQGDVTSCAAAGLGGTIQASGEAVGTTVAPDSGSPDTGAYVDVDNSSSLSPTYGRKLTVTIIPGWHMTGVVVVGGGAYHLYAGLFFPPLDTTLPDLTAPPQSGTFPIIDRYFVCGQKDVDAVPNAHDGDVTTCAEAGLTGSILVAATGGGPLPDQGDSASGTIVDVEQFGALDGRQLSVRTGPGFTISGIVVGAAGAYNVYSGPFPGPTYIPRLVAPAQGQTSPVIDYYIVCGGPSGSPPTTTTPTTTTTTTTSGTTTTATDPGTTTTTTDAALPATGASLTGLVLTGVALVAGGVALLVLRRRRAATGE